ncbi:MAG: hypothetical protein ABI120_10010 [Gemmatimonadaceae bacterium]
MSPLRTVSAVLATTVGLALLAALSAIPFPQHAPNEARLRLSFSARPERIEVCRTLSDDELAKLAEHMRQRMSCEGVLATYTLRIEVDGTSIGESVVRGAGLRHDRPLYLLQDYPVPPGKHRFRVSLVRREKTDDDAAAYAKAVVPDVDTGLYAGRALREASERARRAGAAIPPSLVLDTTFILPPLRVALIRFNSERRALELYAEGTSRQ